MGMSDLYGPASESLAAPGLALTESDLKEIERAVPWKNVSGERYSAQGMAMLDSESKR
jgi:hypothetical protein